MIKLFQKASEFVREHYNNNAPSGLLYHNYHRALTLLERANSVFDNEKVSAQEASIIQFALLFSQVGYAQNYHAPYKESISIFKKFIANENVDEDVVKQIEECISVLHTHDAQNRLQQITSDIYYSDYGKKKFSKLNPILRKEILEITGKSLSESDWVDYQIKALTSHQYYTKYAIDEWQSRKRRNLADLLSEQSGTKKTENKEKLKAYYKQKYKNESPERGIQTLYRVALRNHIKLSDIADTKANILLSVNAIIISLIIANLVSKLENPANRFMILPTILFVGFSIASMIMSIKATQPNVTRNEVTDDDIKNKRVNLAFFGSFHTMEFNKYRTAFMDLIKDKEDVYNTLTQDLYFLGSVLDSKYKLLRNTYWVFMIGIIVSVIAFTAGFMLRDVITL